MKDRIVHDHHGDGIDRRGFLKCMAWAGTGLLWSMSGGVLSSRTIGPAFADAGDAGRKELTFVQISDSHIGFNKEANKDVTATLREAVARINALATPPAFLIHTGDLSHLSKPEEFDTLDQILKSARVGQVFSVPGEHDVLTDNGKLYRERYGRSTRGGGWYSFDHQGAHFVGLVNVLDLKAGGLGTLGSEQLGWLERDLRDRSGSQPIVVFAHIPLWTVYPEWGWGTDDSAQALSYLRRFGSVTVLNGHIHQIMQKVEGNITFHTAMSTAFPQPAPGAAPSPGPLKVPPDQLRHLLGVTSVHSVQGRQALAVVDTTLESTETAPSHQVTIDNFSFTPNTLTIPVGATVTWVNHDDIPHTVVDTQKRFKSPPLDTSEQFSHRFTDAGTYAYYCSIHPHMTAKLVVQ